MSGIIAGYELPGIALLDEVSIKDFGFIVIEEKEQCDIFTLTEKQVIYLFIPKFASLGVDPSTCEAIAVFDGSNYKVTVPKGAVLLSARIEKDQKYRIRYYLHGGLRL